MQTRTKRPQPDIRAITRLVPPSGNLVQGQNDVALHPDLEQAAKDAISEGLNHYSFFEGTETLRRAVTQKLQLLNGITVDPDKRPLELMITPGATGGLVVFAVILLTLVPVAIAARLTGGGGMARSGAGGGSVAAGGR